MNWSILICLIVLARRGDSGALKCSTGSESLCVTEQESKDKPEELSIDDIPEAMDSEVECLAGTEWQSNCHLCRCSDAGVAECLRQESCDTLIFTEPIRCQPGSSFKRDCNTCVCLDNGLGLCSLDACRRSSVPKKTDLIQGRECAPGSQWMNQCNVCHCDTNGYGVCETNNCKDNSIEPEKRCSPNTMWKNECNTCWCTSDGKPMCTKMGCDIANLESELEQIDEKEADVPVLRSSKNTTKAVVCVAKRMFIKDCNTCWCNEDGTSFYCTRRVCVPSLPEDDPEKLHPDNKRECKPNEKFQIGCNTCVCNPEGTSYSCTRISCIDDNEKNLTLSRKVRASQQETVKTCQPGQEFRLDCNKCLCDNEGKDYSCTRMDCDALNNNHNSEAFSSDRTKREVTQEKTTCIPGSVYDQGCNICRCTDEGHHATCTMKRCHQDKVEQVTHDQDPGFRCNPGEQFTRDCNDCTCSADGRSIFCTLRLCDHDITPQITTTE